MMPSSSLSNSARKKVNMQLMKMMWRHMLAFMVWGIFSNLEFLFAEFPTRGVTGDTLFPIVWEAIHNIEECGLKVMVVTADGASPNRKFFKMHKTSQKVGEIVYKTPNQYSLDNRDIYFMSDVPHLIKTIRNCWSNSFSHSNTRALWVSLLSCPDMKSMYFFGHANFYSHAIFTYAE